MFLFMRYKIILIDMLSESVLERGKKGTEAFLVRTKFSKNYFKNRVFSGTTINICLPSYHTI